MGGVLPCRVREVFSLAGCRSCFYGRVRQVYSPAGCGRCTTLQGVVALRAGCGMCTHLVLLVGGEVAGVLVGETDGLWVERPVHSVLLQNLGERGRERE